MPLYTLKPMSEARVLIVNDDGIDARGIKALEEVALGVGNLDFEMVEEGIYNLRSPFVDPKLNYDEHYDLDVLSKGGVTITPITTNWTCHETLKLWTT